MVVEDVVEITQSIGSTIKSLEESIIEIDHVAVAVEDLEQAIDWYIKKLGFKILERRVTRGEYTAMRSAVLRAGKAAVVLIQGTTPQSQVSRFIERFGPGVQHIAFSVEDIDVALKRLEDTGGAADTPLIADEGIRQVFLKRDPGSGVRVELIERRGGSFTDETVEKLFRAFEKRELF
jgi:methylmalonyl-CoA epimerase